MENWYDKKSPFQDFNEERTSVWISLGITKEEAREWLELDEFNWKSSFVISWLINNEITNDDWKELDNDQKNKLINKNNNSLIEINIVSCDHCSKLVKKTLIFFTNQDNSSFCSSHCKLIRCQKRDLDFYSENYPLCWKRNINNWLEQNYPQNGVCKVDQTFDFNGTIVNNYSKRRAEITHLGFIQKQLTGDLDISSFSNLIELQCYNNQLTAIIFSPHNSLKSLNCADNQLTNLDLKSCLSLEYLICSDNQLNSLELNNCLNLKMLKCWNSKLTSLTLPKHNKIVEIIANNNYLTTFNYDCLNLLTLKDLKIFNNNLEATNIHVFMSFVNLISLAIGNEEYWIKEGNQGNQFTGSFASLQGLTKLEKLYIWNLSLQPDLEYLPNNLQSIICTGQIKDELELYGQNLTLWQACHSQLMKKVNKEIINLTDYQLVTKKQISVHPGWFQGRESRQASFNYPSQFTYSSFLVKDAHPFSWENNALEHELSEKINISLNIPTKLYHIPTKTVMWTKNISNISSYAMLSYAWGDLFDQTNRATWNYNYRDKDDRITAEKLGVYPEHQTIGTTRESIKALRKSLSTLEFINKNLAPANKIDYLWMDQMCINQFDNREKEREVPKMGQYYSQVTVTLISIDAKVGMTDRSDRDEFMGHLMQKIFRSAWFSRAWTFQEGLLSKQTIFMFDDALVDGRSLALYWGGIQGTYNIKPCIFITPFGWSAGNKNDQSAHLTLGEALFSITRRDQTILLDKIYAILGLLPYGDQINVEDQNDSKVENSLQKNLWNNSEEINNFSKQSFENFSKQSFNLSENKQSFEGLENKLTELINQAYLFNPKEILTYLGERNSTNWWLPIINSTGSFQIAGSLNYDSRIDQNYLSQIEQVTKQGIQLKGHWTKKSERHIIELERVDRDNTRWNTTLQFTLNHENKVIIIKQIGEEECYYLHGKQQPTKLFLDMFNYKVIEGEIKIKAYLRRLEAQNKLTEQLNTFQIET